VEGTEDGASRRLAHVGGVDVGAHEGGIGAAGGVEFVHYDVVAANVVGGVEGGVGRVARDGCVKYSGACGCVSAGEIGGTGGIFRGNYDLEGGTSASGAGVILSGDELG